MTRALLIDMDDTLFDEGDYVRSGFRAVAEAVAKDYPGVTADDLHGEMIAELAESGRGKVFDAALARAGLAPTPERIADLVATYRTHRPAIAFWPGVAEALKELKTDYRLAVITDGLGIMQRRKVAALGLEPLVDLVVYCWELDAPKPHPRPYRVALEALGSTPSEALVIGDNPAHDLAAAEALGCGFIRVAAGRFAAEPSPALATVARFADIPHLLRTTEIGRIPCPQRP